MRNFHVWLEGLSEDKNFIFGVFAGQDPHPYVDYLIEKGDPFGIFLRIKMIPESIDVAEWLKSNNVPNDLAKKLHRMENRLRGDKVSYVKRSMEPGSGTYQLKMNEITKYPYFVFLFNPQINYLYSEHYDKFFIQDNLFHKFKEITNMHKEILKEFLHGVLLIRGLIYKDVNKFPPVNSNSPRPSA